MSLIISSKRSVSSSKPELPSEGAHPAKLKHIKDRGNVETKYGTKHRVLFVWELQDEKNTLHGGSLKVAFQDFNYSFDTKSQLYKAVRQILGYEPPDPMDLDTLLGSEATIVIEHHVGAEGEPYASVVAVVRKAAL